MSDPRSHAPALPRTLRLYWALWIVVVILLSGEVIARAVTYWRWKAPLLRHPELAHRLSMAGSDMKPLTTKTMLDGPNHFPAPLFSKADRDAAPRWTTFDEFPADGFRTPPKTEQAAPGVIRIAFVGGSTTFNGYPEEVGALMDQRFGPGRVEVINMGVPASSAATTLVLMRRFLPKWQPHIVVQYEGFNDLYFGRALVLAQIRSLKESDNSVQPLFELPPKSRGLWSVLSGRGIPSPPTIDPWFEQGIWDQPLVNYWEMSRMAWSQGFDFYVSTFASPDYAHLSPEDQDGLDTNIRYLWPLLISTHRYAADLAEYNRRLRQFAGASGTPLIDVATGIHGGLNIFEDNCHLRTEGIKQQAKIAFDALSPRVEALLARGAQPTNARTPPSAGASLTKPAEGLPSTHALDGRCQQGPCPGGTCYVPGGVSHYGYSMDVIKARILPQDTAAIGFSDPSWFQDDQPDVQVSVSPFCIDRTEATVATANRCRTAGVCAPYHAQSEANPERMPAVFPLGSDATTFCAWRGGRLPTEIEWDAAARGPSGRIMPWGDSEWTGHEANYCGRECRFGPKNDPDDGFPTAAPVGSFPNASPYGAVDMAGNLWEWMADCFQDSSHDMVKGKKDPLVRTEHCKQFLHGGSFASYAGILERRNAEGMPDVIVESRGARCAFDFGTVHTIVTNDSPKR
jgi:formylglycine-generating enzyme required for sulfatase activity